MPSLPPDSRLFRSSPGKPGQICQWEPPHNQVRWSPAQCPDSVFPAPQDPVPDSLPDRKSTRQNSSHWKLCLIDGFHRAVHAICCFFFCNVKGLTRIICLSLKASACHQNHNNFPPSITVQAHASSHTCTKNPAISPVVPPNSFMAT